MLLDGWCHCNRVTNDKIDRVEMIHRAQDNLMGDIVQIEQSTIKEQGERAKSNIALTMFSKIDVFRME